MTAPNGRMKVVTDSVVGRLDRLDLFWFSAVMGIVTVIARLPVAAAYAIPSRVRPLPLFGIEIPYSIQAFLLFPVVEAFLGQWLPIRVVSGLGYGEITQVIVAALTFCFLHLPKWAAVATAFLPGVVLAYAYITWARRSPKQALWATVLTHVWENAAVMILRSLWG